jgi:hypothetical protein
MEQYKLVIRSLVAGSTVMDEAGNIVVQNANEFAQYLNDFYLKQGFTIKEISTLKIDPGNAQGLPPTYEFAYHLVKSVDESADRSE